MTTGRLGGVSDMERQSCAGSEGTMQKPAAVISAASDEPLWKVADVAAYMKFSRSWVYKQLGLGRIPHVDVLGYPRFIPAVIRQWAATGAAPM